MTAIAELYERMIAQETPIAATLQTRIAQHLVNTKSWTVLGKLAARADVCDEADRIITARKEAQVVSGWARRPGLPVDLLLTKLAKEKRVTVLLPLANLPGLPDDVYIDLLGRQSQRLNESLLANIAQLPPAVQTRMTMLVVQHLEDVPRYSRQQLLDWVKGNSVVREHVLDRVTDPGIILELLTVQAPTDELLGSIVTRLDKSGIHHRAENDEIIELLTLLVRRLDAPEQVKSLRKLVRIHAPSGKSPHWGRSWDGIKHLVGSQGSQTLNDMRLLATTTDTAQAARLFKNLLKSMSKDTDSVMDAAVTSPVLEPAKLHPHFDQLTRAQEITLVRNWSKRGLFEDLAKMADNSWGEPAWLDADEVDQAAVMKALIGILTAGNGLDLPDWVLTRVSLSETPEYVLGVMPWQTLHALTDENRVPYFLEDVDRPRYIEAGKLVTALVQDKLVEQFGDDNLKWEMFHGLADEFEGSLLELLETVNALNV